MRVNTRDVLCVEPHCTVMTLQEVASSGLNVFAHNIETVERLQAEVRDRRANWRQSLSVLATAKEMGVKVSMLSVR